MESPAFPKNTGLFNTNELWFPKAPSQFIKAEAPPSAPFAAPNVTPTASPWYKTRWIWILLVVILVLCAAGYWARTRYYSEPLNPYSAAIKTVPNADHQADLQEWATLWKQARRPDVKRVLGEVLNSELGPPAADHKTPSTVPTPPAAADPAFTVA